MNIVDKVKSFFGGMTEEDKAIEYQRSERHYEMLKNPQKRYAGDTNAFPLKTIKVTEVIIDGNNIPFDNAEYDGRREFDMWEKPGVPRYDYFISINEILPFSFDDFSPYTDNKKTFVIEFTLATEETFKAVAVMTSIGRDGREGYFEGSLGVQLLRETGDSLIQKCHRTGNRITVQNLDGDILDSGKQAFPGNPNSVGEKVTFKGEEYLVTENTHFGNGAYEPTRAELFWQSRWERVN